MRERYWLTSYYSPALLLARTTVSMNWRSSSWVMAMVPTGQSEGHFFWSLISRVEANDHTQQTNLQDIVQDADERVAILESRHHASFFITPLQNLPTSGASGTRVTCISVLCRLPKLSGRVSGVV